MLSSRGPASTPVGLLRARWDIVLVIAAGGALGSLARWSVGEALPRHPAQIPWNTWLVNLSGALLIGVLMVFVADVWPPSRHLRPFLGVGVLGGYTTFSTYALDTRTLVAQHESGLAAAYLFGTLVTGLAAVWAGAVLTRAYVALRRRTHRHRSTDRRERDR